MSAMMRAGINATGCNCIRPRIRTVECKFKYIKFGNSKKRYNRDKGNIHDGIDRWVWDELDGELWSSRCVDCGVNYGLVHHIGCDDERCPKCFGQLLSCDCADQRDYS